MSARHRSEVRRIARKMLADAEAIAQEMLQEIRAQGRDWDRPDAPQLDEALLASCLANIRTGCEHMAGDLELPGQAPADARALAHLSARWNVSLAELLRSYRVGYALMLKRWYGELEGAGMSSQQRSEAMQSAFDYLFEYVDRISSFVTDAYTAERDRRVRSREQRRAQLVRQILDGTPAQQESTAELLDYDLSLEHVACILCGAHPEEAIRELARALDAPHRLLIALATDLAWAWLGRTQPFADIRLPTLSTGSAVFAGDPAAGVAGFRSSHLQALEAHRVGALRSSGSARFDEVALEAIGSADPVRAQEFVRRELGELADEGARAERLRQTLQAYFASGQSAVGAAGRLGVHEHTITYRLRTIEATIGRPVAGRRAELELALRLMFVLNAQIDARD